MDCIESFFVRMFVQHISCHMFIFPHYAFHPDHFSASSSLRILLWLGQIAWKNITYLEYEQSFLFTHSMRKIANYVIKEVYSPYSRYSIFLYV